MKPLLNWVLAILIVVGVGAPFAAPYIVESSTASVVSEPVAELQTLVAGIKRDMAEHPQRIEFANYCLATAAMIQRDAGNLIKDAGTLSAYNDNVANLRFGAEFKPVPGLSDAMNSAMLKWAGDDPGPITPERRNKVIECYQAFAWAAGG
jgi:hypothetical protein